MKDKRSTISFEESDETCVILTLQSGEVITIKPSDNLNSVNVQQFIKAKQNQCCILAKGGHSRH